MDEAKKTAETIKALSHLKARIGVHDQCAYSCSKEFDFGQNLTNSRPVQAQEKIRVFAYVGALFCCNLASIQPNTIINMLKECRRPREIHYSSALLKVPRTNWL